MKIKTIEPARTFSIGSGGEVRIDHCADIQLDANEQVTFVTPSGTQYDVVRKEWGYYATPSTNSRLINHDLRAALVINPSGQLYVMLCESGKEREFEDYLSSDNQQFLIWLDSNASVQQLRKAVAGIE